MTESMLRKEFHSAISPTRNGGEQKQSDAQARALQDVFGRALVAERNENERYGIEWNTRLRTFED